MRSLFGLVFLLGGALPTVTAQEEPEVIACMTMDPDGANVELLFPYRLRAQDFAVSPNGSQVAYVASGDRGMDIWLVNIDGSGAKNITNTSGIQEFGPSWAPDGKQIAYAARIENRGEIFSINSDGSSATNLTNDDADDSGASWSPDGQRIAFASDRSGSIELFSMLRNGTDIRRITFGSSNGIMFANPQWSPDGSYLACMGFLSGTSDIFLVTISDGSYQNLTSSPLQELQPTWSPDGSLLAYTGSSIDGTNIYVMDPAKQAIANLTENIGINEYPAWTPDGRIIFSTRRQSAELHKELGPATTLFIIDGGGLAWGPRQRDMTPIMLERKNSQGEVETIPLNRDEAKRILRSRGEEYVRVEDKYPR